MEGVILHGLRIDVDAGFAYKKFDVKTFRVG